MPVEQARGGIWIPIACRFVPNDQWFVTHVDNSWKIEDVKRLLLSKCLPEHFEPVPSALVRRRNRRPVSPITFAPREELSDAEDGSGSHTAFPQKDAQLRDNLDLIPRVTTPAKLLEPSQYLLITFSTGQILDDFTTLEWHSTRPCELLELHRHPYVPKLPRFMLKDYLKPYFALQLWVFRYHKLPDKDKKSTTVKMRRKAEWVLRWMFIREGRFVITENHNDVLTEQDLPLSALATIRDNQRAKAHDLKYPIEPPASSKTWPWMVFLKFEASPKSQSGSVPWLRRGSRDAGDDVGRAVGPIPGDGQTKEKDHYFNLLAPSEQDYHNMVRVLHREARAAQSSFLSKRSFSPLMFASTPTHSDSSSPESTPPPSRSPSPPAISQPQPTLCYPEWRKEVVERAQRVGLGDVGRAIVLARFGLETDESDIPAFSETRTPSDVDDKQPATPSDAGQQPEWSRWQDIPLGAESDNDSLGDEVRSECEWENWEADVLSNRIREDLEPPPKPPPKRYGPVTAWSSTTEYTFPNPSESGGSSLPVPSSTLTHYSSADSLVRHPARKAPRSQTYFTDPLSPLISQFDPDTYEPEGLAVPVLQQFYPDTAYPSRQASFESSVRGGVRRSVQQTAVPLSMAIPTITSTVSAGPDPPAAGPTKKKKGKTKDKGKGKQKDSIQFPYTSLVTRQLVPSPASSSSTFPLIPSASAQTASSRSITPGEAKVDTPQKSTRTKPRLSFAQVAAMGTPGGSTSSRELGLTIPSAVSSFGASSFESPTFAHPPDSDELSD